ncbi:MAG: HAD family hydrolase, partial [Clostridia bacterium]|nr:HAD family hydrolase [Clostridia bacterium]
ENFDELKNLCGFNAKAKQTVDKIKSKGLRVALATNPVFPRIATQKRISWAGLDYTDFELCTTYENSKYSKPNLNYYKEILTKLNVKAEECLMIGNDVSDDMVVKNLNMKVFLLTDCLINTNNEDISVYPNGNFDDLISYIDSL